MWCSWCPWVLWWLRGWWEQCRTGRKRKMWAWTTYELYQTEWCLTECSLHFLGSTCSYFHEHNFDLFVSFPIILTLSFFKRVYYITNIYFNVKALTSEPPFLHANNKMYVFFFYRYGLHIWKVAVNILNMQRQAIGKGRTPAWGLAAGQTTNHFKNLTCYTISDKTSDLERSFTKT